jgi:hypothetical protein
MNSCGCLRSWPWRFWRCRYAARSIKESGPPQNLDGSKHHIDDALRVLCRPEDCFLRWRRWSISTVVREQLERLEEDWKDAAPWSEVKRHILSRRQKA